MLTSYIIGSWSLVVGLGLLILGIVNIELPSFQEEVLVVTNIDEITKTSADKQQAKNNSLLLDRLLLFCGILFVFFMSGIDILFQSHIYIFGLCGPLKLSAQHAGWLNTVYFVSFLIGRIVGIPLSMIISPTIIIYGASIGCLVSSIILIYIGMHNVVALFVCTGLIGFHVCFFVGSIINWLTLQIKNMTSKHVSIIILGGPIANSLIPPLASKLFYSKGPIFVLYTSILCVILLIFCFIVMNVIAERRRQRK